MLDVFQEVLLVDATQVERAVEYERNPQLNVEWYDNALSVASNQGGSYQWLVCDVTNDYLWNSILSDFTYDSFSIMMVVVVMILKEYLQ